MSQSDDENARKGRNSTGPPGNRIDLDKELQTHLEAIRKEPVPEKLLELSLKLQGLLRKRRDSGEE